jgi:hypothetical protein
LTAPDSNATHDLYTRLMSISQEAHTARLFSAAYHALAAALHCARTLPQDGPLEEVAAAAEHQLSVIDNVAPDYEHSTRSAAARGHDNIFTLLARQARTVLEMRKTERKRDEWSQGLRNG